MATYHARPAGSATAADAALAEILAEIAVPRPVLDEAKKRRNLALELAMRHQASRAAYVSGSVAHGTHNRPLEDTDCGIKVDRRYEAFRQFGPDGDGRGPEEFIQMFASFLLPLIREHGYPDAEVNLEGNRAIKLEFNECVELDEWGPVDPYVDLIVALDRRDGGIWIPNRRRGGWDIGDPEYHTWLMTERDRKPLRVLRAHVLRLGKRAVKRDDVTPGRSKVMCSWNLSALGLELVVDEPPIAAALGDLLAEASASIATGLTADPSPMVEEPISLPSGVTCQQASERLSEMASIVAAAMNARSKAAARRELDALYGPELDAIRERERIDLDRVLGGGRAAAPLPFTPPAKPTNSHGSWGGT
jgi:hypothetical protein